VGALLSNVDVDVDARPRPRRELPAVAVVAMVVVVVMAATSVVAATPVVGAVAFARVVVAVRAAVIAATPVVIAVATRANPGVATAHGPEGQGRRNEERHRTRDPGEKRLKMRFIQGAPPAIDV
jgi:hypothetical protein